MYKYQFITAAVTILASLIMAASNISFFIVPSSITTFAQVSNQEPTTTTNSSPSSSGSSLIRLVYTKVGVLDGNYQRVSYDSNTNVLSVSKSIFGANASSTSGTERLPDAKQKSLEQLINKNGFFAASSIYPPRTTGTQDYTLYILSITMNNRLHTVLWADTSSNVPNGLLSIVQAIENMSCTMV
jgi:hypothetical protein